MICLGPWLKLDFHSMHIFRSSLEKFWLTKIFRHRLLPYKTLQLTLLCVMISRYNNFSAQVQKFGVQFVFLIFADVKFAGGIKGNLRSKKIRLKWKGVKNAKKRAITDLNAPNGSWDVPFQSQEFGQDGHRHFLGFQPHFQLNMTSQTQYCKTMKKWILTRRNASINMSSTWRHKFYWFWLISTAYSGTFCSETTHL